MAHLQVWARQTSDDRPKFMTPDCRAVKTLSLWLALAVCAPGVWASPASPPPPASQNLVLIAPIRSWDEALPLGNGLTGGLLWGEGNLIRLSLDRGDLWDERPHAEPGWWKKRTWKVGGDWDGPYNGVTPTKLPAGRIEMTLDESQRIKTFELNLATAEGWVHFHNGHKLDAFFSATSPVALLRIPGPEPRNIALIPAGSSLAMAALWTVSAFGPRSRNGTNSAPANGAATASPG